MPSPVNVEPSWWLRLYWHFVPINWDRSTIHKHIKPQQRPRRRRRA